MLRFALAIVAICFFGLQADAQVRLFRRPVQAQCTQCTVDPATGVQTCSGGVPVVGGFVVGQRDSDGAVITSIATSPTVAKSGTQVVEQLAIGDRIKFRRSLLAAAKQARNAGDITPAQYFLLSAASRNPLVLDRIQQAVHEAAIEEGLATAQAIDWDSLIGFIEKLIPIIIQLIDLFS